MSSLYNLLGYRVQPKSTAPPLSSMRIDMDIEPKETDDDIQLDSVVTTIINKFKSRAIFGFKKYGTNLDRNDLSVLDWIQHAQEEHMDAILYLEKLKQEITKNSK
jgi:hypothetical protein